MLTDEVSLFITKVSEYTIYGLPGVCFRCEFSINHYEDRFAKTLLGEALPESLNHAVDKRKAEFVAGRYAAKIALELLNSDVSKVSIGKDRLPIWPPFYTGSISHTRDIAICVVSKTDHIKSIGIDIENCLESNIAGDIINLVLTETEFKLVGNRTRPNPVTLTLIFSAKESLFKALYLEVGLYFGFDAARVLSIDFDKRKFYIELIKDLTPSLMCGRLFEGLFQLDEQRVLTAIICFK